MHGTGQSKTRPFTDPVTLGTPSVGAHHGIV